MRGRVGRDVCRRDCLAGLIERVGLIAGLMLISPWCLDRLNGKTPHAPRWRDKEGLPFARWMSPQRGAFSPTCTRPQSLLHAECHTAIGLNEGNGIQNPPRIEVWHTTRRRLSSSC